MDETKLHIAMDKIIEGHIWLSTTIDYNVDVETLSEYCE